MLSRFYRTVPAGVVLTMALAGFLSCIRKTEVSPKPESGKEQLIEADCAFASMAADSGVAAAFAFYAADSAVVLRRGGPITGREAIRKLYSQDVDAHLSWEPYFADISVSGDLGYTLGSSEYITKDSTGAEITFNGHYVTIWKKQADGSWKWVFDTGASSPAIKQH